VFFIIGQKNNQECRRRWLRDRSRSRLREAAMLQKLTEEIAECYRHATECRQRANRALDPATKTNFLNMERRWLSLAHSYEFAERLSDFTATGRKRGTKNKAARKGGVFNVSSR
jgi:hypothetical protein